MILRLAGRSWHLSLLLLMACLLVPVGSARADTGMQQAVAASQIVYGVISYTRWPQEIPGDTLDVCVVGQAEHSEHLVDHNTLLHGRRVVTRHKPLSDLPSNCAVVYVGLLDLSEHDILVRTLIGKPILVISEQGGCTVASMICLSVSDKRSAFEINLDAVARSGIRIHPSVLKLARPQVRP
jgi:hypothetical protein